MSSSEQKQFGKKTIEKSRSGSSFKKIALTFFIIGAICASPIGQVIYVIGLISVLGIPLSFLMVAIPNIAFIIVTSFLLWRFVPQFSVWGIDVAVAAAISLMFLIPLLHNLEIKSRVNKLQSESLNTLAEHRPFAPDPNRIVGIVVTDTRPLCSALCVHLLLSGQSTSVIVASVKEDVVMLDMTAPAYEYSLKKQADCPRRKDYKSGVRVSKSTAEKDPDSIASRYFQKLDTGYCMRIEETTLAEADMVVTLVKPRDFPDPRTLSPIAAKFSATHSAIYLKIQNNALAPIWRQTAMDYSLLGPVLLYTVNVPAGLSGTEGRLWREDPLKQAPSFKSLSALLEYIGYELPDRLI